MDPQVGQEALYRAMLQQASDAMFLLDAATMAIVEANLAAERMSGYNQDELRLLPPTRLLTVGPAERPSRSVANLIAIGLPEFEAHIRSRDGSRIPVSIGVSKLLHEGVRYVLLIVRDMSERQRQAKQSMQAEKLAAMGRLTASIAHEINNPLQALHNSLHLLLNRPVSEEKREQILNMAHTEVDQLILLVQRMLEFHRPSRDGMRPLSVHSLLESVLTMAANQIQLHGALVERDWAERSPWVIGIGGHLKQVFLNLATNALEAMPDGGRLTIRTRVEDEVAGDGVPLALVEFVDNGPGIPESEAHMIFEPFYTSKSTSTGLGLAISYSIVEQHGGTLSVRSDGDGTTFRVVLPVASGNRS